MEQQVAQQTPAEKVSASDLINRIVTDYGSKDKDRAPRLLDSIAGLLEMGKASGPNTSALLKKIGEDAEIRAAVIDRLVREYSPDKYEKTEVNIKLARLIGMDTDSLQNTKNLIKFIEHERKKQQQKRKIRIDLGKKAREALVIGVLSIAAGPSFIAINAKTLPTPAEAKTIPAATMPVTEESIGIIQENQGNIIETEARISLPSKEQRILYPKELTDSEVTPWIGQLRNSHDSVLIEALFTKELASMSSEKREETMQAIAKASVQALIEHYGNSPTIVGIDPGHGGTDIGSSARTPDGTILLEKDLTWQLALMVSEEIYSQSKGGYFGVMLRPQYPVDEDLDKDGTISAIERLQKRKALLRETQKRLGEAFPEIVDGNIVYLSLHFNDYPDQTLKGTETFWPNDVAVNSEKHRLSSKLLAQAVQEKIVAAIIKTGYAVGNLGAKEDPDRRPTGANSDPIFGPYIALGSPKLDRHLKQGGKN
ncbi:MAG: N-acetylmuramoyl-L-alanine amidase [Candidatus Levybacteria bacterium]|nr:N-acetylmuramoyl-L-alanine amidase [Candidatus Levybacteria bacterium]